MNDYSKIQDFTPEIKFNNDKSVDITMIVDEDKGFRFTVLNKNGAIDLFNELSMDFIQIFKAKFANGRTYESVFDQLVLLKVMGCLLADIEKTKDPILDVLKHTYETGVNGFCDDEDTSEIRKHLLSLVQVDENK